MPGASDVWKDKAHWKAAKDCQDQAQPPHHNPASTHPPLDQHEPSAIPDSLLSEYATNPQPVDLKPWTTTSSATLETHRTSNQSRNPLLPELTLIHLNPQKERCIVSFPYQNHRAKQGPCNEVIWGNLSCRVRIGVGYGCEDSDSSICGPTRGQRAWNVLPAGPHRWPLLQASSISK